MDRLTDELNLGGKLVGLGIDRIDYTKGIPHRFRAMGRFLEKFPEYIGKVVLVQAGVISRIQVDAYQQLSAQIEELLEEINGKFGCDGWQPIIYMPTDLPDLTLMALRRMARFCVVSSLHDGMNLVAKEYVASRFDEDGVLILSPFTGAALELTDALIVNPYAIEQFADAIHQAVEMPREERRSRMIQMREIVRENNIYKWAALMVEDLMQGARRSRRPVRTR
jgi:trehalose 6-phosphate synthase